MKVCAVGGRWCRKKQWKRGRAKSASFDSERFRLALQKRLFIQNVINFVCLSPKSINQTFLYVLSRQNVHPKIVHYAGLQDGLYHVSFRVKIGLARMVENIRPERIIGSIINLKMLLPSMFYRIKISYPGTSYFLERFRALKCRTWSLITCVFRELKILKL